MKKLFLTLLILPLTAFSFEIGSNYLGAGINIVKIDGKIASTSETIDGASLLLGGNYHLPISEENKYGVDIFGGFLLANGLKSTNYEVDVNTYTIGFRPFIPFESGSFYIDGQFQWGDSEFKNKVTSAKFKASSNSFVPGIGVQYLYKNLIFNPNLHLIRADLDGEVLGFSVGYKINETYSVGIDYSFIDYDSASLEGTSVAFEESQINFGLTYSF